VGSEEVIVCVIYSKFRPLELYRGRLGRPRWDTAPSESPCLTVGDVNRSRR